MWKAVAYPQSLSTNVLSPIVGDPSSYSERFSANISHLRSGRVFLIRPWVSGIGVLAFRISQRVAGIRVRVLPISEAVSGFRLRAVAISQRVTGVRVRVSLFPERVSGFHLRVFAVRRRG